MKIIIDIPEEEYRKVQDGRASVSMMRNAIRNGTPLENIKKALNDEYGGTGWVDDRLERVCEIIDEYSGEMDNE